MMFALLSAILVASPACSGAVVPTAPAPVSQAAADSTQLPPAQPSTPKTPAGTDTVRHDTTTSSTPPPAIDTAAAAGTTRKPPIATDTVVAPPAPPPPAPPPPPPPPARLLALQVGPAGLFVTTGASQLFRATGTMSDGSAATGLVINWTAQGGTITAGGLFTAGTTIGTGSVTATVGAVTATVPVTVSAPVVQTVLIATRGADDFVNSIGVNTHLGYWDTPYGSGFDGIVKPRLIQLGVRHARDAGTVVSDDSWMQSVYGRMRDLADRGIKFDLVMLPAAGSTDFSTLGQWNRLISYAGYAVESFEGLNEHDLSGRPNWVGETRAFQMALFGNVRADGRTASLPVYGPSIGQPGNAGAVGSLTGYLSNGNLHPYPGGKVPLANLASHEQLVAPIGGSGAWVVTETGYHTALASTSGHPAVSEDAMARYIPRVLLDNFGAGITRSYLYEFLDEGTSLAEQEQNFGLLRYDGSPKPAFTALQNLIALLSDPGTPFVPSPLSIRIAGDTAGVTRMAFSKRDGRQYLVLWQDVSSFNLGSKTTVYVAPKQVTLEFSTAMQLGVYDPLTSASAQSTRRVSSITVPVADTPLVIEIGH